VNGRAAAHNDAGVFLIHSVALPLYRRQQIYTYDRSQAILQSLRPATAQLTSPVPLTPLPSLITHPRDTLSDGAVVTAMSCKSSLKQGPAPSPPVSLSSADFRGGPAQFQSSLPPVDRADELQAPAPTELDPTKDVAVPVDAKIIAL